MRVEVHVPDFVCDRLSKMKAFETVDLPSRIFSILCAGIDAMVLDENEERFMKTFIENNYPDLYKLVQK